MGSRPGGGLNRRPRALTPTIGCGRSLTQVGRGREAQAEARHILAEADSAGLRRTSEKSVYGSSTNRRRACVVLKESARFYRAYRPISILRVVVDLVRFAWDR